MQAHRYGDLLEMIISGELDPMAVLGKTIRLDEVPQELERTGRFGGDGITIINRF